MRRIGFFGDSHGCIDEVKQVVDLLRAEGVDEIWHAGDLVDRGPDPEAVVQYCIENDINGVAGNHDRVIVELYEHWVHNGKTRFPTKSPDKQRTLAMLSESSAHYLNDLPYLAVFDDIQTILVHGGLFPNLPFHKQQTMGGMICRLQMINPSDIRETRWFNIDRKNRTEEQNREEGYERWYKLYNHEYNVVFGHSVFREPLVYQNGYGTCYGIDQGSCFGGSLTGLILPDVKFVSVPCIDTYNHSKDLDANADNVLPGFRLV